MSIILQFKQEQSMEESPSRDQEIQNCQRLSDTATTGLKIKTSAHFESSLANLMKRANHQLIHQNSRAQKVLKNYLHTIEIETQKRDNREKEVQKTREHLDQQVNEAQRDLQNYRLSISTKMEEQAQLKLKVEFDERALQASLDEEVKVKEEELTQVTQALRDFQSRLNAFRAQAMPITDFIQVQDSLTRIQADSTDLQLYLINQDFEIESQDTLLLSLTAERDQLQRQVQPQHKRLNDYTHLCQDYSSQLEQIKQLKKALQETIDSEPRDLPNLTLQLEQTQALIQETNANIEAIALESNQIDQQITELDIQIRAVQSNSESTRNKRKGIEQVGKILEGAHQAIMELKEMEREIKEIEGLIVEGAITGKKEGQKLENQIFKQKELIKDILEKAQILYKKGVEHAQTIEANSILSRVSPLDCIEALSLDLSNHAQHTRQSHALLRNLHQDALSICHSSIDDQTQYLIPNIKELLSNLECQLTKLVEKPLTTLEKVKLEQLSGEHSFEKTQFSSFSSLEEKEDAEKTLTAKMRVFWKLNQQVERLEALSEEIRHFEKERQMTEQTRLIVVTNEQEQEEDEVDSDDEKIRERNLAESESQFENLRSRVFQCAQEIKELDEPAQTHLNRKLSDFQFQLSKQSPRKDHEELDEELFSLECEIKRCKAAQYKQKQDALLTLCAQIQKDLSALKGETESQMGILSQIQQISQNLDFPNISNDFEKSEDFSALENEITSNKLRLKEQQLREVALSIKLSKISEILNENPQQINLELIEEAQSILGEIKNELNHSEKQHIQIKNLHQNINEAITRYKDKEAIYKNFKENFHEISKRLQNLLQDLDQKLNQQMPLLRELLQDITYSNQNQSPTQKNLVTQYDLFEEQIKATKSKAIDLNEKMNDINNEISAFERQLVTSQQISQAVAELENIKQDVQKALEKVEELPLEKLKKDIEKYIEEIIGQTIKKYKVLAGKIQDKIGFLFDEGLAELDQKAEEVGKLIELLQNSEQQIPRRSKLEALLFNLIKKYDEIKKEVQYLDCQRRVPLQSELDQAWAQLQRQACSQPLYYESQLQSLNKLDVESDQLLSDLSTQNRSLKEIQKQISGLHFSFTSSTREIAKLQLQAAKAQNSLQGLTNQMQDVASLSTMLRQVLEELDKAQEAGLYKNLNEGHEIKEELDKLLLIEDEVFGLEERKEDAESRIRELMVQIDILVVEIGAEEIMKMNEDFQKVNDVLEKLNNETEGFAYQLEELKSQIGDAQVPELISDKLLEVQTIEKLLFQQIQSLDKFQLQKYPVTLSLHQTFKSQALNYKQEIQDLSNKITQAKAILIEANTRDISQLIPLKQSITDILSVHNILTSLISPSLATLEQNIHTSLAAHSAQQADIRYGDVIQRNSQLRSFMAQLRARLEAIERGAQDCDGYTSNADEAHFISSVISEVQKVEGQIEESEEVYLRVEDDLRQVKGKTTHEILDILNDTVTQNEKAAKEIDASIIKLEESFMGIDVQRKLEKRRLELKELKSICEDFEDKLTDMKEHLVTDLSRIQDRAVLHTQQQKESVVGSLLDENGNPVNVLGELQLVSDELHGILEQVTLLQSQNEQVRRVRDTAEEEFSKVELGIKSGTMEHKDQVFLLLRVNGQTKKRIIELIKQLKDVSKRIKETKGQYQTIRKRIEKEQKQRKLYKAVAGDRVDEMLADHINKHDCPVPLKRVGVNQYIFGTKKISAKIINDKLVIRVGGGYMGIEEFIMYYGQQELQKIQKEEQVELIRIQELHQQSRADSCNDSAEYELLEKGCLIYSVSPREVNINQIQSKIKENKKELMSQELRRSVIMGLKSPRQAARNVEERLHEEQKAANVVGIGEVRKALKQNLLVENTKKEFKEVATFPYEKSHARSPRPAPRSTMKSPLIGKKQEIQPQTAATGPKKNNFNK